MPHSASRHPLPNLWQPLWEGFERHLRIQGRSGITVIGYLESLSKLADHMIECCGRAPDIFSVDRGDIEEFILRLQAARLAENTVLRHFRGLAVFFKWLAQEDLIERSPMERLRPPKVKLNLPPVLPAESAGSACVQSIACGPPCTTTRRAL